RPLRGVGAVFGPGMRLSATPEPPRPPAWVARCSWPGGAPEVRASGFPRLACITRAAATAPEEPVPPGPASVREARAGWLVVEAEGPGWLVTTQPWYPGWAAWLDGASATVEVVDGALVGLALPAGIHTV